MTTLATHNPQDTTTAGSLFVAFELSGKSFYVAAIVKPLYPFSSSLSSFL